MQPVASSKTLQEIGHNESENARRQRHQHTCEHCHYFRPDKEGVELPDANTQEIEQRLTLFERITDIKPPISKYRRLGLPEHRGAMAGSGCGA
jgi:hypothetical protein